MSKIKSKKSEQNYLDRVPTINKKWNLKDDGLVEVVVENTGFYNTLAQKIFKKPRFSFIKLDKYGTFVWQHIDGKRTIYDIGQLLKREHKEANVKLYERLAAYFAILEQHKYIVFVDQK